MRMWMIPPKFLCRSHLLGEHGELHKFRHNFEKKHNMSKRIELRQIFPHLMRVRHDELVKEMKERKYNHKSPYGMPDISYLKDQLIKFTQKDYENNINDLMNRCEACKQRIGEANEHMV